MLDDEETEAMLDIEKECYIRPKGSKKGDDYPPNGSGPLHNKWFNFLKAITLPCFDEFNPKDTCENSCMTNSLF